MGEEEGRGASDEEAVPSGADEGAIEELGVPVAGPLGPPLPEDGDDAADCLARFLGTTTMERSCQRRDAI